MKKRFVALLLCLVMVLSMLPGTVWAAVADLLQNTPAENQALLEELADGHDYGQVLRAKGMLKAADGEGWYYFDLVPGEYEIRMGEPEYTGKVCVIGSGLQEDKLAEAFAE